MAREDPLTQTRQRQRTRSRDDDAPIIPILARKVREVEQKAAKNKLGPTNRQKFQVIALLMREERARVKADASLGDAARAELLKRLDGIAQILAKTAARDTSLITLLEPDASVSTSAQRFRRDWLLESGAELSPDELIITREPAPAPIQAPAVNQVIPASVRARQLANPFLAPDFDRQQPAAVPARRLANWELLGPLFKAFEQGSGGQAASMDLPEPPAIDRLSPRGLELMPHQARFIEAAREGHRAFLLADEPGLGKTAQSVLAASVTNAYPLLAVVPNVVKMNWAREVERWTPHRRATVIHGDGDTLDAFADVVVVNYDILDRHMAWLSTLGFRGMVVDEAHFIKNLQSQRSRNVLALADRVRASAPGGDPLLLALTGTPLINDVDDFRAIWQFLGWIAGDKPSSSLLAALEENGLTPAEHGFYSAARRSVIDLGIVRRRKVDVAADLPEKRIADLPVELDDELGRSIRAAERELGRRLATRFRTLVEARGLRVGDLDELDRDQFVRAVAMAELEESKSAKSGENVFTMVRRIGQAKAGLAADYAAQLARSAGKVVFFAKHIDVMDQAEAAFAARELTSVSIRGDQTAIARQAAIDAFNTDPDVHVAVCSLTAAGVGVNLQAASNVVLAELSWTSAEQTQAIDRVHRIGQDEPVTAWRIIAAHTIDARIAELIDAKQGLAARALDGSDIEPGSADSVQLDALQHLLRQALDGAL
ncbi:DEAD/DEAH box helicase [Agromyces sp. MMS24-JH15]|uniref:DEAD/DEAH box helicase n=1 Tax=Agromyces sp. MMS24-JH15 TaxID=3243765 RepID=UPI003747B902